MIAISSWSSTSDTIFGFVPAVSCSGYVQLAQPLAAKGTYSVLLGWRGDDPVIGLVYDRLSSIRLFVAAWDVGRRHPRAAGHPAVLVGQLGGRAVALQPSGPSAAF